MMTSNARVDGALLGGRGEAEGEGRRPLAMGEVNLLLGRQMHVEWPAEGLSRTGAPGQLPCVAHPLTAARCDHT